MKAVTSYSFISKKSGKPLGFSFHFRLTLKVFKAESMKSAHFMNTLSGAIPPITAVCDSPTNAAVVMKNGMPLFDSSEEDDEFASLRDGAAQIVTNFTEEYTYDDDGAMDDAAEEEEEEQVPIAETEKSSSVPIVDDKGKQEAGPLDELEAEQKLILTYVLDDPEGIIVDKFNIMGKDWAVRSSGKRRAVYRFKPRTLLTVSGADQSIADYSWHASGGTLNSLKEWILGGPYIKYWNSRTPQQKHQVDFGMQRLAAPRELFKQVARATPSGNIHVEFNIVFGYRSTSKIHPPERKELVRTVSSTTTTSLIEKMKSSGKRKHDDRDPPSQSPGRKPRFTFKVSRASKNKSSIPPTLIQTALKRKHASREPSLQMLKKGGRRGYRTTRTPEITIRIEIINQCQQWYGVKRPSNGWAVTSVEGGRAFIVQATGSVEYYGNNTPAHFLRSIGLDLDDVDNRKLHIYRSYKMFIGGTHNFRRIRIQKSVSVGSARPTLRNILDSYAQHHPIHEGIQMIYRVKYQPGVYNPHTRLHQRKSHDVDAIDRFRLNTDGFDQRASKIATQMEPDPRSDKPHRWVMDFANQKTLLSYAIMCGVVRKSEKFRHTTETVRTLYEVNFLVLMGGIDRFYLY